MQYAYLLSVYALWPCGTDSSMALMWPRRHEFPSSNTMWTKTELQINALFTLFNAPFRTCFSYDSTEANWKRERIYLECLVLTIAQSPPENVIALIVSGIYSYSVIVLLIERKHVFIVSTNCFKQKWQQPRVTHQEINHHLKWIKFYSKYHRNVFVHLTDWFENLLNYLISNFVFFFARIHTHVHNLQVLRFRFDCDSTYRRIIIIQCIREHRSGCGNGHSSRPITISNSRKITWYGVSVFKFMQMNWITTKITRTKTVTAEICRK